MARSGEKNVTSHGCTNCHVTVEGSTWRYVLNSKKRSYERTRQGSVMEVKLRAMSAGDTSKERGIEKAVPS